MAVTIESAPNTVQSLGEGVCWTLRLSSFGAGTETKKIGYQLFEQGTDNPITPLRAVRPTGSGTPDDFVVDFTADIIAYGVCRTKLPTLGFGLALFAEEDDEIIQTVYLKYGELTYDSSDCSFANDVTNDSANHQVIASAAQMYDVLDFNGGDAIQLNNMPLIFQVFPDTVAWLWAYNAGGTSVTYTATFNDGTTDTLVSAFGASHDVGIIGLTNAAIDNHFGSNVIKLETLIAFATGDVTYVANYGACPPTEVYHEIYVLDPLGGYNMLIAKVQTDVASTAEFASLPLLKGSTDYARTGSVTVDKKSSPVQTYTAKIRNTERALKYVQALAIGTHAFIRIRKTDGSNMMSSFRIEGSTIKIFQTDSAIDLSFKGQIGHPLNVI